MKHGGKRKGAGRKPLPYAEKMVRVPVPILSVVKDVIKKFKVAIRDRI